MSGPKGKRKKRKSRTEPDKARPERIVIEAMEEVEAEQRRRAFERVMDSLALSKPAFGPRRRRI